MHVWCGFNVISMLYTRTRVQGTASRSSQWRSMKKSGRTVSTVITYWRTTLRAEAGGVPQVPFVPHSVLTCVQNCRPCRERYCSTLISRALDREQRIVIAPAITALSASSSTQSESSESRLITSTAGFGCGAMCRRFPLWRCCSRFRCCPCRY